MRRLHDADAMLVGANVLWSLNFAVTKYAVGRWQPLAFSGLRFLAAGVALSGLIWLREGGLGVRRADTGRLVAAAATGISLNQLTFMYAIKLTAAANVALILASSPAFAALFALALGHERVHVRHWAGLAVSLAGVVLVIEGGAGVHGGGSLAGDLLAVGAAVTWAAYSVMLRPLFARYSAGRVSALVIVVGAALIAPLTLPDAARQDYSSLGALHVAAWGYATVFPLLVTNLLYFRSLRRVGAARATLFMYLQPFLAAVFAALLLEERLAPVQVAGGAAVIAGVALGRRGTTGGGAEQERGSDGRADDEGEPVEPERATRF
jgi:drug/metabolite transporter (DMT)-like permease